MNYTNEELDELLKRNKSIKISNGLGNKSKPLVKVDKDEKLVKKAKFNNQIVKVNKLKFQSRKESVRYFELIELKKLGTIMDLKLQETFILQRAFTTTEGERIQSITYTPDYTYRENLRYVIEDVKGFKCKEFKRNWKMMKERYKEPEYEYRIT